MFIHPNITRDKENRISFRNTWQTKDVVFFVIKCDINSDKIQFY